MKLLAVVVVAVNGLWNPDLITELGRLPCKVGRRALWGALLRRAVGLSVTSQVGCGPPWLSGSSPRTVERVRVIRVARTLSGRMTSWYPVSVRCPLLRALASP